MPSSTHALPAPSAAAQVRTLLGDLTSFLGACGQGARTPMRRLGWRGVAAGVYVSAVVGDILTTQWGMMSGVSEEANGVAAAGMGLLGPTGYVILASVVAAVLALAFATRPRSVVGWTVQLGVIAIAVVKCWVVAGNTLMLLGLTGGG